jgi:CubicO group peptidase (beta-lactamase class C family)
MSRKTLQSSVAILFACMLVGVFCEKENPPESRVRYPEAAAQNMDVDQLIEAFDAVSGVPGIQSMVLGRHGVIAAEEFYNGGGPEVLHDVRSVTKSVIGLLVGIAIGEGLIGDIDQTIDQLLPGGVPDTLDEVKKQITIENLLTMSCGLEWHELDGGNSYNEWLYSGNPVAYVLSQNLIHQPGHGFNYNTGSMHLLSHILTWTSDMSTLEFARRKLFEPMGIDTSDWTVVSDGVNNGGAGLKISPHAMFALGTMMLNHGEWNGVQVVPRAWVDSSTVVQNLTNDAVPYGPQYGYLWWIGQAHGHPLFFGMGWGGQFVVCVPDLDLVVAASCRWQGVSTDDAGQHWYSIVSTIMEVVIPAVRE